MSDADIGVIGGSGFYHLLDDAEPIVVDTPFGTPSDEITVGTVAGRRVAFLPRHGRAHRFPPHRINYRANLWALRMVGVRRILAPCAVGSLRRAWGPGTIVVPDQLVDRTSGRVQTFFDEGGVHVGFADPYCPSGRAAVLMAASRTGMEAHDGATMVVVEGQRFSTRAESQWFAAVGWSLVNMTGYPEAVLARELALCYTTVALVTDYDAGLGEHESVDQATVLDVFSRNVDILRRLVLATVREMGEDRDCRCPHVLDGLTLPFELP